MDYQGYHRQLMQQLLDKVNTIAPFNSESFSEQDHAFVTRLTDLCARTDIDEAFYSEGQTLLCQVVACYPHLTPAISRDLFWYFSGDCMHYLSDEEIDMYSQLDEMRYEAENRGASFNMLEAKQDLKTLH